MNKNDSQKLLDAGYTFIRTDTNLMAIKTKSHGEYSHGWKVLENGFKTIKEMEQRKSVLLQDKMTLEM